ncbi:MAG: AAA family ATPase [Candidatus Brocadiae bacterium]|nr:AAA family ATPase [Candidatus Brocadiia bacterium]
MYAFPYGIANFEKIVEKGYFYIDRTNYIKKLEKTAETILFVRPRRFGKSLFLNMLGCYYDVKGNFEKYFGKLEIGKAPTEEKNRYLILSLDFSNVSGAGNLERIEENFHNYCNDCYKDFSRNYEKELKLEIEINKKFSDASFNSLISSVNYSGYKLYVMIDEYDNFANELMTTGKEEEYKKVTTGEGILKSFFKKLKAAEKGVIGKIFITGVSPIVMTEMSSGFNIATNISLDEEFNEMCGFTEEEVGNLLREILREQGAEKNWENHLELMRLYYNGYRFSEDAERKIYNPTLALYFFRELQERGNLPKSLCDLSLSMDMNKLEFLARINSGQKALWEIVGEGKIEIKDIIRGFTYQELMHLERESKEHLASFMYYFGLLTIKKADVNLILEVPNKISYELYLKKIGKMILPEYQDFADIRRKMFQKGDMKTVAKFLEERFSELSNRDYIYNMKESGCKLMFLAIFHDSNLYLMESEPEIVRGYSDLLFIAREDKRNLNILDFLIEFKYIGLGEIKKEGKDIRKMADAELLAEPLVKEKIETALEELKRYEEGLLKKHPRLALKKYIVVGIGFERILGLEI